MKKVIYLFFAVSIFVSCSKEQPDNDDPIIPGTTTTRDTTIGGETSLSANTVGNFYYGSVKIGENYVETNESVVVTESDSGLVTLSIQADLTSEMSPLVDLIPDSLFDINGRFTAEAKYRNTSEGILDYTNSDGEPFILMRYDDPVGKKYKLQKSNGQTITREVISKSATDDYPYGLYMIKIMTVEQDSRIPGVSKILYKANHSFGLVEIEIVMEDGTSTHIYTTSYY